VGDELLAKLKGLNRTFVIHCNTNPYAPAAAMGMMAAGSQESGRYFRPSDTFVPVVGELTPVALNVNPAADQIAVNFIADWKAYLRTVGLPACGLKYKNGHSPEKNTLRFLNANRRIPAIRPRAVRESRELSIPLEYRQDYEVLLALIKTGGDLKPFLSRDILKKRRSDKNDPLLNSLGIQHLHFRADGSDQLLFCVIAESDVFVIQTMPHSAEHLWVNTQLVQILHDNWPEVIARAKHVGLKPEFFPSARRHSLRGYNANFSVTVADGTVYLPLAGGMMASGDSAEDRWDRDKLFSELRFWQAQISGNAVAIRSALNMPDSQELVVRMAFDNRVCCFYEPRGAFGLAASRRLPRKASSRP
jgi:hypothetical protein